MRNHPLSFSSLQIKEIEFKNRIWVSPMCQYSSSNGHPTDWHLVHLGSRAVGGAGMVMVEATAVSPEGRISPDDSGIWSNDHIPSFKRITQFLKSQGSRAGIQIAHAGRKASTSAPWLGGKVLGAAEGGWQTIAPSPIPFDATFPPPREMSESDITQVINDFESAALRAWQAGFEILELHMAHGYLMHEFLSPLSNQRTDLYGGDFESRMRLPLEVTRAVRRKWPDHLPLFVRISATDWAGGTEEVNTPTDHPEVSNSEWDIYQSITFCKKLKNLGVDLIDCSSGGTLPHARIPIGPGYQVQFADAIRKGSEMMTAAVGMITEPAQVETILREQKADAVFIGREFLRNPYWPVFAAQNLNSPLPRPRQYGRA